MKRNPNCTMRDVAAHLGISHATVSRALRDDPRITASVRLSVVKAANKLGYRRDPKLAQLMSHLRAKKHRAFQGTLAWITDHDPSVPAEGAAHELHWEHGVKRAEELGYKLECFPNSYPADAARIERRLIAQGIQGIIIQQYKAAFHPPDWKLNWSRFAIVYNGLSQTPQCLDSVDADEIANCVQLYTQLTNLGYRRIGICTIRAIEFATNYCLGTSLHRFALLHPGMPEIPPCLLPDFGPDSARVTARWLQKHRVDVVVSQVRGIKEMLESIGQKVPQDLGLAYQGVNPHGPNTGMCQREDLIASVNVEAVIASVEQGRFGLPVVPRLTLLQGTWHPGTTCRQV